MTSRLCLLGRFALEIGGITAAAPGTAKARALLAYLVMHAGSGIARERLTELFWPDADPDRARSNLKTATWSIRKCIRDAGADPDEFLHVDRATMQWIAQTATDAGELLEAAAPQHTGARNEAIARYRGAFLEGDYDDWAVAQRERIESAYEALLERSLDEDADPETARRLLERNPYSERAYRTLIEREIRAGRPLAGRAIAQRARSSLREVDAATAQAFETAYAQLLSGPSEAARTGAPASDNLPRYARPIVGRAREIADVEARLEDAPVVTIAGAGGIGKTRVAVAVAQRAPANGTCDDGAWFVDLGRVADPAIVPLAIASALRFELSPKHDPLTALLASLKPLRLLLVLDNCEHLLDRVSSVADAIARECAHVRILATSREPLGLDVEAVYRLDTLDDESAQALFIARARQADQHFALEQSDLATLQKICRRLDGIALAIELAAARTPVMALDDLFARIDERFAEASRGGRTTIPRQQTMGALVDWSYDLLDDAERSRFRALGVFAGGFAIEAAVHLCPGSGVDETIFALVEKSMVATVYAGGDSSERAKRYRLLEPIRDYALVRLRESGEDAGARRRHAEFYSALARDARANFGTMPEGTWIVTYAPEIDNFRAALDWSLAENIVLAAQMAGNLKQFWTYAGAGAEGLARTRAVARALPSQDAPLESIGVWLAIGEFASITGVPGPADGIEACQRAYALAESCGNREAMVEARFREGCIRSGAGIDRSLAQQYIGEAAAFARVQGDPIRWADALSLHYFWLAANDPQGRCEELERHVAELHASGWFRPAILAEIALCEIDLRHGRTERAIERGRRLVELLRARRDPPYVAHGLQNLASYLAVGGEYSEAAACAREALTIARQYGQEGRVAVAAQALATTLAATGEARRAATLLGYVDAYYTRMGASREQTEAIVRERLAALLAQRLPVADLESACAAGSAISLDEACELALS